MPHQRKVIRDAVVALLKAANTVAGSRVYPNRFTALTNVKLPALLVYTLSEDVDPGSADTSPRELTRALELQIHAVVGVEEAPDDALDALALQVETAMHADRFLGGAIGGKGLLLTSTEIVADIEGDRYTATAALFYALEYQTLAPEPLTDAQLDDFETAHVTHKVAGAAMPDADDAEDEFTVEEP
jgi:hypothetical protein